MVIGLTIMIIGTVSLERHGGSGSWLKVRMGSRFYRLIIVEKIVRSELVIPVVESVVGRGVCARVIRDRLAMPLLTIMTIIC